MINYLVWLPATDVTYHPLLKNFFELPAVRIILFLINYGDIFHPDRVLNDRICRLLGVVVATTGL